MTPADLETASSSRAATDPAIAADSGAAHPVSIRRRTSAAPPPSLIELLGPTGLTRLVLLAAALVWVYWDQFVRMVYYWTNNADWSHGFLIPLFCIYFVHSRRDMLAATPVRPSWLGLLVVIGSLAIYIYSIRLKIGYPQALSIVTAIAGLTLLNCGWRVLWRTAFPIGFLVLALPPPEYIYRAITQPLQQIAAFAGEHVLRFLPSIIVERNGINIAFDNIATGRSGYFTVAGACSGMRSLMAFVALGLAMAYFAPRPMWHRIIMAAIVVPVALFCNVIRVVVTGALHIYGQEDWAKGTPHSALGIVTFALGFAIYFGVLYVLDHLYVATDEERGEAET